MAKSTTRRSSSPSQSPRSSVNLSRRELLAGAGAGAAALLLEQSGVQAQATQSGTVVFSHTTVVTGDADRAALSDVALAVNGDTIVAIGPTDPILETTRCYMWTSRREALTGIRLGDLTENAF